jgi:hypothetical protein
LQELVRLLVAHAISFVVLAVFVTLVSANNIDMPIPYFPAQLAWLGVDWFLSRPDAAQKRRRRRSSNMASGTYRPPQQALTNYKWAILTAMGLLTIGYTLYGWRTFSYESISYHDVIVGGSPQDAIYAAGKPVFGRNADGERWQKIDDPLRYSQWMYRQPLMIVRFTPDHRVADIECTNDDRLSQGACLTTLSVGVDSTEGQLYEKLGLAPAGGSTQDGKHIARYPELGHEFVLQQFYVKALRVGPSNGDFLAKLWRFFLWLVP